MSSNYWSSTTNANNTDNAWHVNFNNGNVNNNNKSNTYYVRAVRGGKCSLLSFKSVYKAYLDCRRRKRGTINALKFEYSLLDNLFNLALELQNGTYRPSRSVCFVTTTPKLREIFAADFRDRIVHHKSLFKVPPGKGLPIGNLTSQFLANVYLNELDQFVKHVLKCRFYIRYVDDGILISSDREQLPEWEKGIEELGRLIDRFKHHGVFRSLRGQYLFFRARLKNTVLFFKVGKFLEFYDQDAVIMSKPLRLVMRKDSRGMKYMAGFPVWFEKRFVSKVLYLGKDLAILDEGMPGEFIKDRYVREIYRPFYETEYKNGIN